MVLSLMKHIRIKKKLKLKTSKSPSFPKKISSKTKRPPAEKKIG